LKIIYSKKYASDFGIYKQNSVFNLSKNYIGNSKKQYWKILISDR